MIGVLVLREDIIQETPNKSSLPVRRLDGPGSNPGGDEIFRCNRWVRFDFFNVMLYFVFTVDL